MPRQNGWKVALFALLIADTRCCGSQSRRKGINGPDRLNRNGFM